MAVRAYQIEPSGAGSRVAQYSVSPLTNVDYRDMTYDGQVFYGLTATEVHMWQVNSQSKLSQSKLLHQVKSWTHGVSNAQGISTDGTTIFITGT